MKDCRWEPSEQQDQIASLDELRQKCPVAQSEMLGHAVLTHSDVRSVIEDHETFSNAAGSHLSIPNGMDPPEHGIFREVIEPYLRLIAYGILSRLVGKLLRESLAELHRIRHWMLSVKSQSLLHYIFSAPFSVGQNR